MMSQSLTLEDDDNLQAFSVSLTVYLKVKKTAQGKMTSKEEKSMKTKELLFMPDDSNYLKFLCSILLKHGLTNYQYIPPKAKGQWMGDVIDVNNQNDYREMVKKVSDDNLPVVEVFVDMQHVENLPWVLQVASSGSGDDSEPSAGSDTASPTHTKKADLDHCLT
ncbi:hypothetical protein EDC04DRAFT_2963647 [Pisolithus marmoratus]|nr:hypothetical protein EDC04DRAFT_2963647 [Pisolithus marmoratus]